MTKDIQEELINIIKSKAFTEEKKVEQIQTILDKNPEFVNAKDPNSNLTPLTRVIGNLKECNTSLMKSIVELLIRYKADVNKMTPIIKIVTMDRKMIEKCILSIIRHSGFLEICSADIKEYIEQSGIVSECVLRNSSYYHDNIKDYLKDHPDFFEPLIQKYLKHYLGILELLLENGAEVDFIEPEYKCTALHFAAGGGNLGAVKLLVKYGADINATTPGGFTPLHLSIENGHNVEHQEIAEFLIQHTLAQDHKADRLGCLKGKYSTYWTKCCEEIEEMQKRKVGDIQQSVEADATIRSCFSDTRVKEHECVTQQNKI